MNLLTNKFTNDWITNQMHFWYGKYCWIGERTWSEMGSNLTSRCALTLQDTIETMRTKDFPAWKEDRCNMHLQKIQAWNNIKSFTKNHVFPLRFSDNSGHNRPSISHSRPYYTGHGMLTILDDVWARHKHGSDDSLTFEDKTNKIHFLGSFTGPFVSTEFKTSRVEIISKWFNQAEWLDVGFILKPANVADRPEYKEKLEPMIKPQIQIKECMKHRYILCIEGNDGCSAFSWALASNSVPIHTYPFSSATHFMYGLIPYVHFVPVKRDGSDLHETWQWCQENESKCKEIAQNGREHMKPMQDKELCLRVEAEFVKLWDLQIKHIKKI